MKPGLRSVLAAACTAAAFIFAPNALAQDTDPFDPDFPGMEPLADEDLGNLRGGFFTVDGITFDFGATVRTTIDGQPAMEQRLTWTPSGATLEDISGLPSTPLPGVGGVGLNLSDAAGITLVGHRLVDGQLQGFIVNSANNRDIGQDIQIDLTLPGFDVLQKDMLTGQLGMRIDMDMAAGLVAASGQ